MEIKYAQSKGKLYIYLNGELDEYTAGRAKSEIENAIASSGNIKCVVFNFANTSFMDSTGIGVLLGRYKTLKKVGIPIYIQNPSVSINKILQISGLYEIMPKI
ncbi:MAG: anti-sigma factor antagonist [Clostridia bacterium]|nr:anti-sigma factor antagonist [Clostridiales bacterium]MDD7166555.1 anti-sigma factor antagonist [Clostridia bacterium]MDY2900930.1 anti-sigma factor antagonist [Christensenellaceae bacterium]